ncbi:hypothetical protein NB231_14783 [Nitrococcus mobilis Nb-231]|uniref:Uncharacterized protein n=1 Tax=Nitrococcus mobilis Nb-231 TaxID=314278 RepID=A4BLA7_9GAMM|nr:hypothetical protein NB231_14783 [Nitrococcus mobilis Nb-231]
MTPNATLSAKRTPLDKFIRLLAQQRVARKDLLAMTAQNG